MISKELSEAAVELNAILQNSSEEIISKIPKKFLQFLRENASTTYKFEYDINKTLEEQDLKTKTRGLIALIYKDYLCDEQEKKEYLNYISKTLNEIEYEKREKYNPDNIFKTREAKEIEDTQINNLPMPIKRKSLFRKIIFNIKKFFSRN